jgi:hypothetical protein
MVCLVVENLHDTERFWLLDPGGTIPRIPDKHPVQVRVAQSCGLRNRWTLVFVEHLTTLGH